MDVDVVIYVVGDSNHVNNSKYYVIDNNNNKLSHVKKKLFDGPTG
jgi:hypothetical protein